MRSVDLEYVSIFYISLKNEGEVFYCLLGNGFVVFYLKYYCGSYNYVDRRYLSICTCRRICKMKYTTYSELVVKFYTLSEKVGDYL